MKSAAMASFHSAAELPDNEPETHEPRPLYLIALEIERTWKTPYFGAAPYLAAMRDLWSLRDEYGADSAASIVRYFLANSQSWKGPDARRIKAELRDLLKGDHS